MFKQEYIDSLINIQGFSVQEMHFLEVIYHKERENGEEKREETELIIELRRKKPEYVCEYGRVHTSYYDSRKRTVRDLRYGPYKTSWLVFEQCRVDCRKGCGNIRIERFKWLEAYVGYTKRLAAAVALSCKETRSLKKIGEEYGLHWNTGKEIDKRALNKELPAVGETDAEVVAVDEFAIKKRHHYGTTVADVEKKEVVYVGKGRSEESSASFYRAMGDKGCAGVEAVAMDMWKAYIKATKE